MSSAALSSESTPSSSGGPMQQTIHRKLSSTFSPSHLVIVNESHMHSGPPGRESHFKVTVVSEKFHGLAVLARHRAVNTALAEELKNGIHALSITARSPEQWEKDSTVAKSPACLGGSKHDAK
jgi:stress-induced morphogen